VASGFILGMGFVTGGIGVPVTGVLADHVGVSHALLLTASLIVAAALLVTRIPLAALQPAHAQPELALKAAD
jgi:FSR family fosmidomycin resistance protein-like MFS transporter